MKGASISIAVALALGAALCAAETFSPNQLKARSYADLGPETIDVSGYPAPMREKYAVFSKTCTQCHSLARSINAPFVTRADWKRYVARMHMDTQVKEGTVITSAEAAAIIDFLVYDAKVRKVQGKTAFDAQTAALKAEYKQVKAERLRLQIKSDDKHIQNSAPDTGAEPK